MKLSNLKALTFETLVALRDGADRLIVRRAAAEKKVLEGKLADLARLFGGTPAVAKAKRGSKMKGRKVAPKYRNPKNRSQTWAGRGMRPIWLQDLLKQGRKIEDFAVSKGTARRGRPPGKRKPGRPRKVR